MGIEDREYVRRPTYGGGGGYGGFAGDGSFGLPVVCKWLVILNAVVFVLQLVWTRPALEVPAELTPEFYSDRLDEATPRERDLFLEELRQSRVEWARRVGRVSPVQEWLELDPERTVLHGQVWRAVTYAFCHDRHSPWHILVNMWMLWMFGPALERMLGTREFLAFYLAAAVVSAALFLALGFALGQVAPAIGASGAVVAVLMLFAWHFPRHTILLFFIIPVEIRWLVFLYVVFELHPILLQIGGEGIEDRVAHAAHVGGLAFGFFYGKYNLTLTRLVSGWRRPRLRRTRHVRIYQPPREDLDQQVDRILQKIHEHGEASLTDHERSLLKEASQRYKQR